MILGQAKPSANTDVDLTTITTKCSVSIFGCTIVDDTVTIALIKSGETLADKHKIFWDTPITVGDAVNLTGIALDVGDKISVKSTLGNVAFSVTSMEV